MAQRIGLIGLNDLAPALTDLGFEVISAPAPREAIIAINADMKARGKLPVLVLNLAGVQSVTVPMGRSLPTVVLCPPDFPDTNDSAPYSVVDLPTSLSTVLSLVRQQIDTPLMVDANGAPYQPTPVVAEPEPEEEGMSWDVPDEPVPAPVAPVAPIPAYPGQSVEPAPPPTPAPVPTPAPALAPAYPVSQPTPAPAPSYPGQAQSQPWTPPTLAPAPAYPVSQPTPAPAPSYPGQAQPQQWTPPTPAVVPNQGYPGQQQQQQQQWTPQPAVPTEAIFGTNTQPVGRQLGQVIFSLSGKGGVGKSTFSLLLADRASKRGKTVVLVDGNYGQGDLAGFLKITNNTYPTAQSFVYKRDVRDCIIGPDELNHYRPDGAGKLSFAFVAAPSDEEINTGRVTPEVYRNIVGQARQLADLVIVDTQIIEADDPRGMVRGLVVDSLREGAWAMAITDISVRGISNLLNRMKRFGVEGANPQHLLSINNRVPRTIAFNMQALVNELQKNSVHMGTVWDDPTNILQRMNQGVLPSDHPDVAFILDQVLYRMLGMPPVAREPQGVIEVPKKKGFFDGMFGSKKKPKNG